MNYNNEYINSLTNSASNRKLVIFCGAGISMLAPSKVPSWWEIYYIVASSLINRFEEAFPEYSEKISAEAMLKLLTTQQLADLIITEFAGESFVEMLKVIDVADPNENHMLISALASKGCLKGIVTTNWDTLLERTASICDTAFNIVTPDTMFYKKETRPTLIKLHGSAIDAKNLKESFSDKAKEILPTFIKAWKSIIQNADLLVLGYSGSDVQLGIVNAFFEDFLNDGGNIFWLHRVDSKPSLPDHLRSKVKFIENELPDFLKVLGEKVNVSTFETPVTNRNAQQALRTAMDEWSHSIHINKWGAAKFLLSLLDRGFDGDSANTALYSFLMKSAKNESETLNQTNHYKIEHLAFSIFLSEAGLKSFKRLEIDDAEIFLRTAVDIHETVHLLLNEKNSISSEEERFMNLSSSWINYGHILVLKGNMKLASTAFLNSLKYAYKGGDSNNFLITLSNIFNYVFEFSNIRESMKLVEAGIKIADRLGHIQPSIELRLHLVAYHISRNEIWIGELILKQAQKLISAIGDFKNDYLSKLLVGFIFLKKGDISLGLNFLSKTISDTPAVFALLGPVDMIRRHLDILGVPNEIPFVITINPSLISDYIKKIEKEIVTANNNKALPWHGKHCGVYKLSAKDSEDLDYLFNIGIYEFKNDFEKAVSLGLLSAKKLIEHGFYYDANWYILNLLARTQISTKDKAYALFYSVYTNAELGNIDNAHINLKTAKELMDKCDEKIPFQFAECGFWLCMQSGDVDLSIMWAKIMAETINQIENSTAFSEYILEKIKTYGSEMFNVEGEYLQCLKSFGLHVPEVESVNENEVLRFKYFKGINAEINIKFNTEVANIFANATTLLNNKDVVGANSMIDDVINKYSGKISKVQEGELIALQIQAITLQYGAEAIFKFADLQREQCLSVLNFTALTLMEGAVLNETLLANEYKLAAQLYSKYSFVADFADQFVIKLHYTSIQFIIDIQLNPGKTEFSFEKDFYVAKFYDTPEYKVINQIIATKGSESTRNSEEIYELNCKKEIIELFSNTLKNCNNINQADIATNDAVQALKNLKFDTLENQAQVLGNRACWSLLNKYFDDAEKYFLEAEAIFRDLNNAYGTLNAMAGAARALSRSGKYEEAVNMFKKAIQEGQSCSIYPNLLTGLAAAHLIEGSERNEFKNIELINKAIIAYKEAIELSKKNEKALLKLGLARALGERGDQKEALQIFDEAFAEIASLGSPFTKDLIKKRFMLEEGKWHVIELH